MWPRISLASRTRLRQKNRTREIALAMARVEEALRRHRGTAEGLDVLEIGAGDGTQCRHLRRFGRVTATDRFQSPDLRLPISGVAFAICDSRSIPLPAERVDLVYANHVIEHIPDLPRALAEMRRVGRPGCLYAFSVPTTLWLLLSLPGQYWDKFQLLLGKVFRGLRRKIASDRQVSSMHQEGKTTLPAGGFWRKLLPTGHGEYPRFLSCLWAFRTRRWRRLFATCGFDLLGEKHLLLYATSRWPIVPTMEWPTRLGLSSSRLYLLEVRREPGRDMGA